MILTNPTHTIVVYTEQTTIDTYDNPIVVPSEKGIVVQCRVTPISTSRDRVTSRVNESYKVITADTSTTRWIRVKLDDKFYTVDEWKLYNSSESTKHIEATIREET